MQLGTRWRFGDTPPNRLGEHVVHAVSEAERMIATEAASAGHAASASYWTLTWLEGRAVCEHDDGTQVREQPSGQAVVLLGSESSAVGSSPAVGHLMIDDDDDDWLNG
ncbi:hypothetical protein [Lysinibacter cavernae]|uniref:Uncharacterized protein n=1 Tax=Lysinibacter cavernae TaxID=1640652 RepID=A0A7X5QZK7_9MICO|nr:hypothetical protein [Lysinibacter cavernae]NIH52879.1 hypothetical protein [Lysinibacter cavernae]